MNKQIFLTLAINMFIVGSFLSACQSNTEKEDDANKKLEDAQQELHDVKQDANEAAHKEASAEEWKTFKNETEQKINDNEVRINQLKIKKIKSDKILDPLYEGKIDMLEKKNIYLKAKMDAYEKGRTDWESFKIEFNHDMDELGKALNDLTVDNKK